MRSWLTENNCREQSIQWFITLSKALVARNSRWLLSAKLSIMPSAVLSHSPYGLSEQVPYHFFSDPGPRNYRCPRVNLWAYSPSLWTFAIHFSWFLRVVQSMSLYIDKMMIFLLNSSGSHFDSVIIFWISSRIPTAVNPGKNSTRVPCVPRRSDPILFFLKKTCFQKPFYRVVPCLDWMSIDTSQT